jgi:hypothetical protein
MEGGSLKVSAWGNGDLAESSVKKSGAADLGGTRKRGEKENKQLQIAN